MARSTKAITLKGSFYPSFVSGHQGSEHQLLVCLHLASQHQRTHRPQGWRAATSLDAPAFLPETAGDTGLGETFLFKTQSTNYCLSSAHKPKRAAGHIQAQLQYLELKKRHLSEPHWDTDRKAFLIKRSFPHKFCDLALYP